MIRRAIFAHVLLLAGTLLLADAVEARPNPKLADHARTRLRDQRGRFTPVKAFRLTGWANPPGVGQSRARIDVQPATARRAGSITVKIPEYYTGSSWQGSDRQKTLNLPGAKLKKTPIDGRLTIARGSRTSPFSSATYTAVIPAGTPVTAKGLETALQGLFVNPWSLKPAPLKKIK